MTRAAHAVLFVSLALWVGGLATISFVVAPTAFQKAPTKEDAGQIVGSTLRTFGRVEIGCGLAAFAASLVLSRLTGAGAWARVARPVLIAGMLTIALTYVLGVYPMAAQARIDGQTASFSSLHRASVILVSINILAGAAALAISAAKLKPSDGA